MMKHIPEGEDWEISPRLILMQGILPSPFVQSIAHPILYDQGISPFRRKVYRNLTN